MIGIGADAIGGCGGAAAFVGYHLIGAYAPMRCYHFYPVAN